MRPDMAARLEASMKKLWHALELATVSLLLAGAAAPAMASRPTQVPEPGTLGLLTVGIGGAYLISKYLRRK